MPPKHVVQVALTDEQKTDLVQEAKSKGQSVSEVGRAYITKGMGANKDQAKAADLVAAGTCPNMEEALKLVKAIRGEW